MENSKNLIHTITEKIFSTGLVQNFTKEELVEELETKSYENLVRLELFIRIKKKFASYVSIEGLEVIMAFCMLCNAGAEPEFDDILPHSSPNKSENIETIEDEDENREGLFLLVTVYKKDDAFIINEIKSRGLYEINRSLASTFRLGNLNLPYPLTCLENFSKDSLKDNGFYEFNPLGFYHDLNDEIDGTNLFKNEKGEFYLLAWNTTKVLNIIKTINNFFKNHQISEKEKNRLLKIEELLSNYQENSIVKFSLYFDA